MTHDPGWEKQSYLDNKWIFFEVKLVYPNPVWSKFLVTLVYNFDAFDSGVETDKIILRVFQGYILYS